jgi:hypothetical protein
MKTLYKIGDKLEEDQFLLKTSTNYFGTNIGYMTKFNKDKSIPKSFIEWHTYGSGSTAIQTFIFDEYFRPGWKVVSERQGASQNWIVVMHPEGFTLEIYQHSFFELMKTITIVNGVLQGEFKWNANKLIPKP